MPRISLVDIEKRPRVLAVLARHQHPNSARPIRPFVPVVLHIFFPHYRQEQRSRRAHNGDVWQKPTAVVVLKKLDNMHEERMVWSSAHGVIGYSSRDRPPQPCIVR